MAANTPGLAWLGIERFFGDAQAVALRERDELGFASGRGWFLGRLSAPRRSRHGRRR